MTSDKSDYEGTLARLARAGRAHAVVSEITRDPDPEPKHGYEADPQSGAGNCACGASEHHRRHPHRYLRAWSYPFSCVCGLPEEARCHQVTRPGTDGP